MRRTLQALANTFLELPYVDGHIQFVKGADFNDSPSRPLVVVYLSLRGRRCSNALRGLLNSGNKTQYVIVVTAVNPKIFGDLLYKDYQGDQKLTITTYSSTGWNKALLFIYPSQDHKNFTADIKVASDSSILTVFTYDEATPGLKAIVSPKVSDQKSAECWIDSQPRCQFLRCDWDQCIGSWYPDVCQVSFDTESGNFKHFNTGVSFTEDDLIAALTLNDKGENTVVGAEVNHNLKSQVISITVGAQHSLDPLTTVKARVNNAGIANPLIQHEWRPKSFITIFGEVDSRGIEKSAKVGFTIALKP
ncbi:hypothetical protein F2Q70_00004856 [Brassica cretica]|uniref:Uncharacterized protein n=1 Tax=Brassica cretica TaxID=69181 RepID=A0A8S9IUK1_BRACR|nr:hypothetical protein F2Q70_00004856 [Brassica cretica]